MQSRSPCLLLVVYDKTKFLSNNARLSFISLCEFYLWHLHLNRINPTRTSHSQELKSRLFPVCSFAFFHFFCSLSSSPSSPDLMCLIVLDRAKWQLFPIFPVLLLLRFASNNLIRRYTLIRCQFHIYFRILPLSNTEQHKFL